jgi:3-hydroxy-9,10-secoandrosta-1,3,5(10)-triene-9,17-dione monooxygenase
VLNPSADVQKVNGGYRCAASGPGRRGSWHADWALVGIVVPDETGEPVDQASALIPLSELSIKETWFVAGMKGIGSNTMIAKDVFVPEHRVDSGLVQGRQTTRHFRRAALAIRPKTMKSRNPRVAK